MERINEMKHTNLVAENRPVLSLDVEALEERIAPTFSFSFFSTVQSGGAGNDTLQFGGSGNDVLTGGTGNEVTLNGGAGIDEVWHHPEAV